MNSLTAVKRILAEDITTDATLISELASMLAMGKLIVAPTETRYGLLARADDATTVAALINAKGRGGKAPISVFLKNADEIANAIEVTDPASLLITSFMPGPITLVGPAIGNWPDAITPVGKLGIRWSSSPVISAIINAVPFPLTATSANRTGDPDGELIDEAVESLGESVAIYVDGGRLTGPTSTVVDCSNSEVKILREGAIGKETIMAVVRGSKS